MELLSLCYNGSPLWTYIYGFHLFAGLCAEKGKGKGAKQREPVREHAIYPAPSIIGGAHEAESHKVDKSLHFVGHFTAVLYGTLIEW